MKIIYALLDPIDMDRVYIGCSGNPKERFRQHLQMAKYGKTEKDAWIRWLDVMHYVPILLKIEEVQDASKALDREWWWVHYYSEMGLYVYNKLLRTYPPEWTIVYPYVDNYTHNGA